MKKILVIFLFMLMVISLQAESYFVRDVTWTDLVNVTANGNNLTNLTFTDWNSGAFSVEFIPENTNGYVETTINEINSYRMIGLSVDNTDASYMTIDYALYLVANGKTYIYENGTPLGYTGDYFASGDIVGVRRIGTTIEYYLNSTIIYTSSTASTGALHVDTSLRGPDTTLQNVKIGVAGVPEPSTMISIILTFGILSLRYFKKRYFYPIINM